MPLLTCVLQFLFWGFRRTQQKVKNENENAMTQPESATSKWTGCDVPEETNKHRIIPPCKYEMIVAMNEESIIGITDSSGNQRIPWHLSGDLRRFKKKTMGHILVMGRKTFDTTGPLDGRIHIVLSRSPVTIFGPNVFYTNYDQFDTLMKYVHAEHPLKKVFICGGQDIYRLFLHRCSLFHFTIVKTSVVAKDGETLVMFPHSLDDVGLMLEPINRECRKKHDLLFEYWEFVPLGLHLWTF